MSDLNSNPQLTPRQAYDEAYRIYRVRKDWPSEVKYDPTIEENARLLELPKTSVIPALFSFYLRNVHGMWDVEGLADVWPQYRLVIDDMVAQVQS